MASEQSKGGISEEYLERREAQGGRGAAKAMAEHPVGTAAGSVTGAVAGAIGGVAAGPLGSLGGAIAGAALGALAGSGTSRAGEPEIASQEHDGEPQTAPASGPEPLLDAGREFGAAAAVEFGPGAEWTDVEPMLAARWESGSNRPAMRWSEAGRSVRRGFEQTQHCQRDR